MSNIRSIVDSLSFPESCGQLFTISNADEGNNPLFLCTDVTTFKPVQSDDVETSTDLKPLDENNEDKHEYEYEYEYDEYEYEYEPDNTDEDDHDDDSDDDDSDSGSGRSSGSSGGKRFIELEY
jgi:hypothetical protein